MPYFGLKKFICKECGRVFYQAVGDVIMEWQFLCPACRSKALVKKIRDVFKRTFARQSGRARSPR